MVLMLLDPVSEATMGKVAAGGRGHSAMHPRYLLIGAAAAIAGLIMLARAW